MVIMLAQLIPLSENMPIASPDNEVFSSGAPNIPPYNAAIAQLASDLNTSNSPIVLVDQFTGFDQNADLLTDGIHPTISGEQKIADKWFEALEPFFTTTANSNVLAQWPLDENTGTTAFDQTSNAIDLTVNNNPSWVSGQFGSALDLQGPASNQDASTNNAQALQTPSVTLSAWINPDNVGGSQEWIAAQADNFGLYIDLVSQRIAFYIRDIHGGWTDIFSANNSFQFNQWQHVAGSYDASTKTMKVYVNGTELASHTLGDGILYDTGNGFTIGSMQNQRFFDGRIDEVQVYGTALSNAEVALLAAITLPSITSPTPGSTLTSASATFQLNNSNLNVEEWEVKIGTTVGASDIDLLTALGSATSVTSNNLPINGSIIYVQLLYREAGVLKVAANYSYSTLVVSTPNITSPVPNSTLSGATTTFEFSSNNTSADKWEVSAGTNVGDSSYDIKEVISPATSITLNNLPTDGSTIYVRLRYQVNGVWEIADNYTYTAATASTPSITSPVSGSTLTGVTEVFNWNNNASNVQQWYMYAGSAIGQADYYVQSGTGNTTSATMSNMVPN